MAQTMTFEEPTVSRFFFATSSSAWIWLVVRLYLAFTWIQAGWDKVFGTADTKSWLTDGGAQLKGFVAFALTQSSGPHAAVNYGWYAAFLRWIDAHSYAWMAKVIAIGELTIGILLLLGLFTGIVAVLAALMSMAFGLAGVAGVNPVFLLLEILLVLAWRNAGYIGLDRWVLPALGTPWSPGTAFRRKETAST